MNQVSLNCTKLFIGDYHNIQYLENIQLSSIDGMTIPFLSEIFRSPLELKLEKRKIIRTVFYFNDNPQSSSLLFISVAPSCAHYIEAELAKIDISCNLSPTSRNPKISKIVVVFKMQDVTLKHQIESLYNKPSKPKIKFGQIVKDREEAPYDDNLFPVSTFELLEFETAKNLLCAITGYTIMNSNDLEPNSSNNVTTTAREKEELSKEILLYPPEGRGSISITLYDLQCLNDGEFLNDKIINFYLRFIYNDQLSPDQRRTAHFFDTIFYEDLKKCLSSDFEYSSEKERWSRMEKFTKNVNIFEKDYIFVPLHDVAHWMLAVICFPYLCINPGQYDEDESSNFAPCILRFDSMPKHSNHVFYELRSYLTYAHKMISPEEPMEFTANAISGKNVNVPKQENYFDCGIFLLTYAEWFFKSPLETFKTNRIKDMEKWFDKNETRQKRRSIAKIIKILAEASGNKLDISCLNLPTEDKRSEEDECFDGFDTSPEVGVTKKRTFSKRYNFGSDDEDWKP